ncbi:hypothetical protein DFP72DRAFT_1063848 [Ephemerocybe angulata]|uniref:Ribonuclease n=1 Tax=Ephemerocybe angulata TaxID=980116 RepID=A0A8H6M881_9AGAR|nr:hypothetical protein DFP72DRAFT_1063848 [Tulosesus angulatus]
MLGVDEAGRGPVFGPLVYSVDTAQSRTNLTYESDLEEMGFNDPQSRHPGSHLSTSNIKRHAPPPTTNLSEQSENATISPIRQVLTSGIELSEVYVNALGNTKKYQAYLSSIFTGNDFTQTADSKFKIVGGKGAETLRRSSELGSGYPSVKWLKGAVDPFFGFPKLVRFHDVLNIRNWSQYRFYLFPDF